MTYPLFKQPPSMFNNIEIFSPHPIHPLSFEKNLVPNRVVKLIEHKNIPKTPVGGYHNAFLNALIAEGILSDVDYGLSKKAKTQASWALEELQKTIIADVLNQTMEPKLLNGTSCSFIVKDLFIDLLKAKSDKIEKILLIGGGLKKIVASSNTFCEKFLLSLGCEESNKIELNPSIEYLKKTPIHDIDFKIILKPNTDPKEISQHILSFISSKFTVFVSPYSVKHELFSKFAAPPIKEKETQEVQELPNSVTIKRPKTVLKLSYAVITPKVMISFLEEKIPVQLEFLCVTSLFRNYFSIRDSLEIDLLPWFKEKKNEKNLEVKNAQSSFIASQGMIDMLGGIMRIPNPETINEMGVLLLLDGFLKGLITVELDVTLNHLFAFYISSRTVEKVDLHAIFTDITRCLENHHKDDFTAKVFFMFHFFQAFQDKIEPEILSDLFRSITMMAPSEMRRATRLFYTAFAKLQMPIDLIESLLQLGALFGIHTIDAKDPNAEILLKKHCGNYFLQIRMEDSICSHLIVPLPTKLTFEKLRKHLSERKISKEERKVIIALFDLLCSKRTEKRSNSSLFAVNRIFFEGKEELYSTEIGRLLKDKSQILQYIGFQLSLCCETEDISSLLIEFPKNWMRKRTLEEKLLLFQDLQVALSGTFCEKISEWKEENRLKGKDIRIEVLWPLMLSRIEDFRMVPIITTLIRHAFSFDLEKREVFILLDIISLKMRLDPLEAQTLWIGCHKKFPQDEDYVIREITFIKKMWKCVENSKKSPHELQLLCNMACIIESFLQRIKQKNVAEYIDMDFQNTCLSFIEIAFVRLPFEQSQTIFFNFREHGLLPKNEQRVEDLWAYMSYAEFPPPKHPFDDILDSKYWDPEQNPFSAFTILGQIDAFFNSSEPKKGYQLLKKLLEKGKLTKGIEAELSRVLLRRLKRACSLAHNKKKPIWDLAILFQLDLSEMVLNQIVEYAGPKVLLEGFLLGKMNSSHGYSVLINCLKTNLENADIETFRKFDRSIVYFLLIEEKACLGEPQKRFSLCKDLLLAIWEDDSSSKQWDTIKITESLLEAMLDILPSESNEILFKNPVLDFLDRFFVLPHPYCQKLFPSFLLSKKILFQLSNKNQCRYRIDYHIFHARMKYGENWLEASKYLLSKHDVIKDAPGKWIETLFDILASLACELSARGQKSKQKKEFYEPFNQIRQELFQHIEKLDSEIVIKCRFSFLSVLLQKIAAKNVVTSELHEWISQEIESLIKTNSIDYRVIEQYIFWIFNYASSEYAKHLQHADQIVKAIAETDFYTKNPKKWVKTQMYLRKSYEGVTGEILHELLRNLLSNNGSYAANVAVEILYAYQTRINGDDALAQLKKCYELLFDIAEKNLDMKVTLRIREEKIHYLFESIRLIFANQHMNLIRTYSPRNIVPMSTIPLVGYLGKTANFVINAFQYVKDSCYVRLGEICKTEFFSAKKDSLELTKMIFTRLFRILLLRANDSKENKWQSCLWLNGIATSAAEKGIFLGEDGHKEYYDTVNKILDCWMKSMKGFQNKELHGSLDKLYKLIAIPEDKKTFFGISPLYQDLCAPFSKKIRIKRIELFNTLFQGVWKHCELKYKSWIQRWYFEAQKKGFYGKKRQKNPENFFIVD